jgi:LysM repeat protein
MYCNRCGTRLQQGTAICPECGARQHRQTRDIRCARCGGRASAEMAVCPHCGRNLVPAGPRWALWIPLALIVAFVAYWGWGKLPVQQVKQEAAAAQAKLSGLVQIPELATSTATPAQNSFVARSAQMSPTATGTPTSIPVRPPSVTSSPVPTATPPSGPAEYIVVSGDSLGLIGEKLDMPWQTIAAINGINENTVIRPGDKLRLPTVTPAPTRPPATATPTATAAAATVAPPAAATSSAGSTPAATAGATATPTAAATDTPTSVPTAEATATAQPPTAAPRPTATTAPTPTPAPTNTPAPILSAPVLLMPGDRNSSTGEGTQIVLQWQTKENLPLGTVYRVTIMDTEQGVPVTHPFDWKTTSFPVPGWLWGKADQPAREYRWSVQVVQLATDGKGGERVIELSPPSETRTFYWN